MKTPVPASPGLNLGVMFERLLIAHQNIFRLAQIYLRNVGDRLRQHVLFQNRAGLEQLHDSSGESAATTAPRFPTILTRPSPARWLSASRPGIRLVSNSAAIASWRSCSPSWSSPLRIFSRRRSTTAAAKD